jgi:hypothetical protein
VSKKKIACLLVLIAIVVVLITVVFKPQKHTLVFVRPAASHSDVSHSSNKPAVAGVHTTQPADIKPDSIATSTTTVRTPTSSRANGTAVVKKPSTSPAPTVPSPTLTPSPVEQAPKSPPKPTLPAIEGPFEVTLHAGETTDPLMFHVVSGKEYAWKPLQNSLWQDETLETDPPVRGTILVNKADAPAADDHLDFAIHAQETTLPGTYSVVFAILVDGEQFEVVVKVTVIATDPIPES